MAARKSLPKSSPRAKTAPRRVIITGGSGGIGSSIVKRFVAGGATVVNLDRAPLALRGRSASRLQSVTVDLSDPEDTRAAFRIADECFGGRAPDTLVTAAAIGLTHHLLEVKPEEVDRVMAINVRGTLICAQEAAERMRTQGHGRIVVVTSISAAQAWAQEPLYCISKAAQMSLVQCLAVELAPFGILVNAVGPGTIDVKSKGMSGNRSRPDILQHYYDRIPLARMGSPEEIAETIWYLAGVTYATGQTLYVDGGLLAAGLGYFGSLKKDTLARIADNAATRPSALSRRGALK
jgi:NAD(P)-dependent dehydrogenase (short-subunit alcohol dehydrogenase family)